MPNHEFNVPVSFADKEIPRLEKLRAKMNIAREEDDSATPYVDLDDMFTQILQNRANLLEREAQRAEKNTAQVGIKSATEQQLQAIQAILDPGPPE